MTLAEYLILAQTIFFATFSFVVITVGILFTVLLWYVLRIAYHIKRISKNLDNATDEVRKNIIELIEKILTLPFLSTLFNQGKKSRKSSK